jgi:DNA-binding HxlR family transcriptional regulator
VRTGAYALSLLTNPLDARILAALRPGPLPFDRLTRAAGSPAASTARAHLRSLAALRGLERDRSSDPSTYRLTVSGRELAEVGDALAAWLAAAPAGPLALGTAAARVPVKAFLDAWSASIVRALAATPLTLVELDSLIAGLSYPTLERRLATMRRAGQVEPCASGPRPARGRTPYTATDWLRRAIGPIAAAVRWERRHSPEATAPIGRVDVEAGLLLTVPILRLPATLSGRCRLEVELGRRRSSRPAGVLVEVDSGRIASRTSRLSGPADAVATGSAGDWLDAVLDRDPSRLSLSGRTDLAAALLSALHDALFAPAA